MAFAAYYYHALDWSFATTDSYLIRNLGDPNCKACAHFIDTITGLRASNQHVEGGRSSILGTEILDGRSDVVADELIEVKLRQAAGHLVDAGGTVLQRNSATDSDVVVYATWLNGRWWVTEIGSAP